MANYTIDPNMGFANPTPGEDPGPDYAINQTNTNTIIGAHNHSPGNGVPITPNGLNINADLPLNSNNLTTTKTINFTAQSSPLSGLAPNLGCVYVAGNELYYNDEAGNVVQITLNGSVNSGGGSITGLPSGTASASYSAGPGTFIWQSATNTGANMDMASIIIREQTASANGITISSPSLLAADYSMFLPPALPASRKILTLDNSGNIAAVLDADNVTLEQSGNVLQVKNGGITVVQTSGILSAAGSAPVVDQTTPGAYNYVIPANTYRIYTIAVSAGGGGGGGSGGGAGGGGGGGLYYQGLYEVVPGETLTINVGAGGTGGPANTNGTSGGNTDITGSTSGLLFQFSGGSFGFQGGVGGVGGQGAGQGDPGFAGNGAVAGGPGLAFGQRTVRDNSGGNGAAGVGGGGGGSLGSGGNGGSGNNGGPGTLGGGGGGGAAGAFSGGAGGDGMVQIYLI